MQCPFRVTQQGLSVAVTVKKSCKVCEMVMHVCPSCNPCCRRIAVLYDVQGLSVIASHKIAKGEFVAQYAGEMLTNSEADRRLAEYDADKTGVGHALLVPGFLAPCWLSRLAGMCNIRCLFP